MQYKDNKVTDMKIAYIGGGSRGWAWAFMADLALESSISGKITLYDIDKQAAVNNAKIGNDLSARPDAKGKWHYETADTLKDALNGADFVIISILPGSFDLMHVDVHLPERHGIYQSVGDTAGPGGMIRSMRTLPVFIEFAEAIREFAPDAWVINYTNPMSLCMQTLYHVFPEIKAFGCCHEVFGTQKVLRDILEKVTEIRGVDRRDIFVNVLGINHFTWFDSASYKGIDLFPLYRNYIDRHFEEGIAEGEEHWANSSFASMNRVKFDLFRRYGLIAAAGDRHLVEFVDGSIYLKDPETVQSWKFGLTHVDWRKANQIKKRELAERLVRGEEELKLGESGEEGVLLIRALAGLSRIVSNVNIPNTAGQIANLPRTAIVETNAIFERDAIRPIFAGSVPQDILDLTMPHVKNHERILKAVLTKEHALVEEAFIHDPLISGRISEAEARKLAQDMLAATL